MRNIFEIGKVLNLLLHPGICESLSTLLGQRSRVDKEDVVLVLSRQRCQSLILALSQSLLSPSLYLYLCLGGSYLVTAKVSKSHNHYCHLAILL